DALVGDELEAGEVALPGLDLDDLVVELAFAKLGAEFFTGFVSVLDRGGRLNSRCRRGGRGSGVGHQGKAHLLRGFGRLGGGGRGSGGGGEEQIEEALF